MLDILMVVSEANPYSKTGGLGDVGGALPSALAHLGHRVTVVTPRYRGMEEGKAVASFGRGAWLGAPDFRVLENVHDDGVRFWLVDCPAYYDREEIYAGPDGDYPDNYMRFSLLSRAALECAVKAGMQPSIVHAHDWQTGLVPAYLRERFRWHPAFAGAGTVFTIHNLAYQGIFRREVLPMLDLPWDVFTGEGLEFWNNVSFLKAGINFSEVVTTVSRRYAQEIQTAEQGFGFEGILQRRAAVLVGIRNGIDTRVWNPETRPPAARQVQRCRPRREERGEAGAARAVRPRRPRAVGEARHRHGVAHGRSEGPRPHLRRRHYGGAAGARRVVCHPGDGRAAVRKDVARPGRRASDSAWRSRSGSTKSSPISSRAGRTSSSCPRASSRAA